MCPPTSICLLIIGPLFVASEGNLYNDFSNGWIPVSSDTVYEQIKRQNVQIQRYVPSQDIQVLHTDINNALLHTNNLNTLKTTGEAFQENAAAERKEDQEKTEESCTFADIDCKQRNIIEESVKRTLYVTTENQTAYVSRRSKKIADINSRNYQQELFVPHKPKHIKERTYEVTENLPEIELADINSNNNGYTYEVPDKTNQTETLFQILAKYKISKDDDLPNYVLSRKHIAENHLQHGLSYKPIQNQVSNRYNNPNHLPVDPILAVLLSNYGFYLRGMYGRNNKYSNLYGYLASNNIHNNRPFGIYKIFSDTDSSH